MILPLCLAIALFTTTANAQFINICPTQQPALTTGVLTTDAGLTVTLGSDTLDISSIVEFPAATTIDLIVSTALPFSEALVRVARADFGEAAPDIVLGSDFVFTDLCPAPVAGALLATDGPVTSATLQLNVQAPLTALILDVTVVLAEGDQFGELFGFGVFVVETVDAPVDTDTPTSAPVATAPPVETVSPTSSPTVAPNTLPTTLAPVTEAPVAAPVTSAPVPAPVTAAPVAPGTTAITGFTLVNTVTSGRFPITDGASITVPPNDGYSVIADTVGDDIPSVTFGFDGNAAFSQEFVAPYTLCGDLEGKTFFSCGDSFGFGSPITVTAAIDGIDGSAQTVSFTLVAGEPTADLRVTSLQLVDVETGGSQTITSGSTLTASGGSSIEALAVGKVGSIVFDFNGVSAFNIENLQRWFLCRNNGDEVFPCEDFVPGAEVSCTATPFSGDGGSGEAGESLSVTFSFA